MEQTFEGLHGSDVGKQSQFLAHSQQALLGTHFGNIRPVQTFKCLLHKSPLRAELVDGADFLCIRELTGGMYFGEKDQVND